MSGTAEAFSRGKIDGMAMKSGWILTDGENSSANICCVAVGIAKIGARFV